MLCTSQLRPTVLAMRASKAYQDQFKTFRTANTSRAEHLPIHPACTENKPPWTELVFDLQGQHLLCLRQQAER